MTHKPQIFTKPYAGLPVTVAQQQKIIDTVNERLSAKPQQGFCLIGSPGTGKTFMMREIREAVQRAFDRNQELLPYIPSGDPEREVLAHSRITVSDIVTLSGLQNAFQENSVSKLGLKRPYNVFTEDALRLVAEDNARTAKAFKLTNYQPTNTVHLFIDEFDTQPSKTAFAQNQMEQLVNNIYRYAPRDGVGNDGEFAQLVVAMNKSLKEFEQSYGAHVSRRIWEMCVLIDFNTGEINNPAVSPGTPDAVGAALSQALGGLV